MVHSRDGICSFLSVFLPSLCTLECKLCIIIFTVSHSKRGLKKKPPLELMGTLQVNLCEIKSVPVFVRPFKYLNTLKMRH